MGLDSYFRIKTPNNYEETTFSDDIKLSGGIMSTGSSDGSFRGKVYNDLVEAATGVSLYQDEIDHITVNLMSDDLQEFDFEEWDASGSNEWSITVKEFASLQKLFKEAAEKDNCVLIGWW